MFALCCTVTSVFDHFAAGLGDERDLAGSSGSRAFDGGVCAVGAWLSAGGMEKSGGDCS